MGGMLSLVGLGGAADVDEGKGRANGGKDEEEEGEEEEPLRVLNLGDTASIKRVLDDFIVAEVLDRDEIEEDVAWSNVKLVGGFAAIGVALFAQLWPVKFPDNREVLLWCLAAYVVLNVALYMLLVMVEGDNIVFLKNGGPDGKGVAIATRMDRYGDTYEIDVGTLDKRWHWAHEPSKTVKHSVTKWFDEDGILHEDAFRASLAEVLPKGLIGETGGCEGENKKTQ